MPLVREETKAQFHARMILKCEAAARRLDEEAAAAPTERIRSNRARKAANERAFAELHCERLAQAASGPIGSGAQSG